MGEDACLAAPDPGGSIRCGRAEVNMAAHSSGTVPGGNPVPAPPSALPGRAAREGLAGLDDLGLLRLVQSLPRASARRAAACELLVCRYEGLVRSCVRPYWGGPVAAQDLMQGGY